MNNQDLFRTWVERYVQRMKQPPQNPPGTPLSAPDPVQPPVTLPPAPTGTYSFLQGNFGKQFLEEYNKRVEKDYADAPVLKVLSWNDVENVVAGSNPFAVVLINEMLKPQGIHTATQADLEHIVRGNLLLLKGHYEESALVWRSNANPNGYLAKVIAAQCNGFPGLRVSLKDKSAYVFPLHTLSLYKNSSSPHTLSFKVTDPPSIVEAPILMSTSGKYISDTDFDLTRGLPTQVFDSAKSVLIPNRQLYTRDSGLSRLYLGGNLYVVSNNDGLAYSDDDGRVVLVSGAAATQKNSTSP